MSSAHHLWYLKRAGAISLCVAFNSVQAAAQSTCPPVDSAVVQSVESFMESDLYAPDRVTLGVDHLIGAPLEVLGVNMGDDAICSSLYNALSADMRASLDASSSPQYRIVFFEVGDRYLMAWYPPEPYYLRASALYSFDLQMNHLAAVGW